MALAYVSSSTALNTVYSAPIADRAPTITYNDQLCALIGRRVCVHSGGISVAGRLYRSTADIFKVSIDTVDSFADAPLRADQIKSISFSRDTLSPDPIVAYIYLT